MSISAGSKLLWSDIKKLYTDAYDTGSSYNGHYNYLYGYGPRYYGYTREDSGWGAGTKIIPDHVNRIINGFNSASDNTTYRGTYFRRSYNNGANTTAHNQSTVSSGNLIRASDVSALRTYLSNSLNYNPCDCNCDDDSYDDSYDAQCDMCDCDSCK